MCQVVNSNALSVGKKIHLEQLQEPSTTWVGQRDDFLEIMHEHFLPSPISNQELGGLRESGINPRTGFVTIVIEHITYISSNINISKFLGTHN